MRGSGPPREAVQTLVVALMRGAKAMGYYDPDHPVYRRSWQEATQALQYALRDHRYLSLGCGGSHVVHDPEGPPLADEQARGLARVMFQRSVVAIRFARDTTGEDLGQLLRALSEGPDALRASGGVRARLDEVGAGTVDVIEVDYQSLFEREEADLGALVGDDPVVERAIREVLRFSTVGEGPALSIRLDQLDAPESLGGFLDELLSHADEDAGGTAAGPQALGPEGLAELASEAYLSNQRQMSRAGAGLADLGRSAEVLGDALVRLPPKARLELLRKLAGDDSARSPEDARAVDALGQALPGNAIVEAVAAALVDGSADRGTVKAIGNLVKRLRPVERDRQELLDAVDGSLARRGRRADGLVWQEIQSRALEREELGYLKLAFARFKDGLAEAASLRRAGRLPAVPGQEVLASDADTLLDRHAAAVLRQVLSDSRPVGGTVMTATRALIERLETAGELRGSTELLAALVRRADLDAPPPSRGGGPRRSQPPRSGVGPRDPFVGTAPLGATAALGSVPPGAADATARTVLDDLLRGPGGNARTQRLAEADAGRGAVMAEILLEGAEEAMSPAQRALVVERLSSIDVRILEKLAYREDLGRVAAATLAQATSRADPRAAVRVVRLLLRNTRLDLKTVALRALIDVPDPNALGLLVLASGARGDEAARGIVDLDPSDPRFSELKMAAIGALGLTRSPVAVPALAALLQRPSKLIGGKSIEDERLAAAQALSTNGTAEAVAVLQEAARSKKRPIRDAALRATGGAS